MVSPFSAEYCSKIPAMVCSVTATTSCALAGQEQVKSKNRHAKKLFTKVQVKVNTYFPNLYVIAAREFSPNSGCISPFKAIRNAPVLNATPRHGTRYPES